MEQRGATTPARCPRRSRSLRPAPNTLTQPCPASRGRLMERVNKDQTPLPRDRDRPPAPPLPSASSPRSESTCATNGDAASTRLAHKARPTARRASLVTECDRDKRAVSANTPQPAQPRCETYPPAGTGIRRSRCRNSVREQLTAAISPLLLREAPLHTYRTPVWARNDRSSRQLTSRNFPFGVRNPTREHTATYAGGRVSPIPYPPLERNAQ